MSSHTVMIVDVVVLTLCLRKDALWHYAMTNAGPTAPLTTERIQPISPDKEIDITAISAENVTEKSLKSKFQTIII
ncbi:hypothetical protein AM593_01742, partial [Mytilus galloprovincialis]